MVNSFICPICPSTGVFIPSSARDGLLLLKVLDLTEVLGCAEKQAGTTQMCTRGVTMQE